MKEDCSIIIYEIIFHAEKCSNRPLPGAISQIVHWGIGKRDFFHFAISKKQCLSQN